MKNLGNAAIDAEAASGYKALRDKVAATLMKERPGEVVSNRCSACHKIVGTPTARWCRWCRHDWH